MRRVFSCRLRSGKPLLPDADRGGRCANHSHVRIIHSHIGGPTNGVIKRRSVLMLRAATTQQHELRDPTVSNHNVYGS
jgi:hypothetical protein